MKELYAIKAIIAAEFDAAKYPYFLYGTDALEEIAQGIWMHGGDPVVAARKHLARLAEHRTPGDPLKDNGYIDPDGNYSVKALLAKS